jgi:hypothetical protein
MVGAKTPDPVLTLARPFGGRRKRSIREHYQVADDDNFVYRLDLSSDGGKSWTEGQIEMTFRRSKS